MYPRQKALKGKWLVNDDEWRVRYVPKIASKGTKRLTVGITDPSDLTISIKQREPSREQFITWLHEMIHAVEISHDFDIEHKHVYALSEAICLFLEQNDLLGHTPK